MFIHGIIPSRVEGIVPSKVEGIDFFVYHLREEFTSGDLTSPRTCVPGPGTLTIVDTNSKLAIDTARLKMMPGGVGYGNPGLAGGVQTRTAGLTLLAKIIKDNNNLTGPFVGWSTAQPGDNTNTENAFYFRSDGLYCVIPSASGVFISTYEANKQYRLLSALRANGQFPMILGGKWYTWELLYPVVTGNTGTLYPAIICRGTATGDATVADFMDYFDVMDSAYQPAVLISDGFESAFGTTDGLGVPEGGGSGNTWNVHEGVFVTSGGKLYASVLAANGHATTTVTSPTPDVMVGAKITRGGQSTGSALKWIDVNNWIYATINTSSTLNVVQLVGGVTTNIVNLSVSYSAGKRLILKFRGVYLDVYYDDVLVGSGVIHEQFLNVVEYGVYLREVGTSCIDDFELWACGTGGEYAVNHLANSMALSNITLTNPFSGGNRYKVQLHCHTSAVGDDGAQTPADVMTAYKTAGYDAVALTPHDPAGVLPDPGVAGITYIPSVEETESPNYHITAWNVPSVQAVGTSIQQKISDILADGGLAGLAHPRYTNAQIFISQMIATTGYTSIEMYNQNSEMGSGNGEAETKIFEALSNCHTPKALVAVDDCHDTTNPDDFNGGWTMIYAPACTVVDLMAAIAAGNCYATQGPDMTVSVDGLTISVTTPDAATIEFIKGKGLVAKTTTGTSASYTVVGHEGFIVVRITRTSDGKKAWASPIYVDLA